MPINKFPYGIIEHNDNPAIELFGKRLFADQSPLEFLIEFLLVINSPKQVDSEKFERPFPSLETLAAWGDTELKYSPKSRLNLKLFSFLGASRLDSRHETHRQHYKELLESLRNNIKVTETGSEADVLRTLENLFLGFQGVGSGRTWCAQSFLPICKGFLAGETIWSESVARRSNPASWSDSVASHEKYFASNKKLFLARGGEVLYLQVCNALRQKPSEVKQWVKDSGVEIEPKEQDPIALHASLQQELEKLFLHCPNTVTEIAEFIDSGVEPETAFATDFINGEKEKPRYVTAGWCAAESWKEGYIFAVELLRLCKADLDIIERLRLLETACSMQVLRTLAAQSARHYSLGNEVSWPGYRFAVSAPEGGEPGVKRISRHTAKLAEKLIYGAIRSKDAMSETEDEERRNNSLRKVDKGYGGKLFMSLSKRIGLLIPRRGPGVRFTLNEQLLRMLVVTTVPVGGRLTYDKFKELVEARHGLVFDADGFARASKWLDGNEHFVKTGIDSWLKEMLDAAGLLIHLSDSCALVENPAQGKVA